MPSVTCSWVFLFLLDDWTSKIPKSRKYREHLMLSSALFSSVFSQCNLMSHWVTCHRIKEGRVIKPLCLKCWAKGLKCLFNTSKRTWLPDFSSIFQSLPITGMTGIACPSSPPLNSLVQGLDWPSFPREVLPYINQPFLITHSLLLPFVSWLLHLVPPLPSSFSAPVSSHGSVSCPLWILPDVCVSVYTVFYLQ